jgi:nuclear transport factor 2 (NTF2) superfamily protein
MPEVKQGLMRTRFASINDRPIGKSGRFRWPFGRHPTAIPD